MQKYLSLVLGLIFITKLMSQKADLILVNGNIITLKTNSHRCEAMAIAGNKIIAVGFNNEINKLKNEKTKIIDLHGKTIIPGFNDVHQHPAPEYKWEKTYATVRLDTVSSMSGLIKLLKRKSEVTPKGMLIKGIGYNELKLGGQPIKDSLDLASREHPILITHASGHISAVNSMMLELNGIDKNTKDPNGGALERFQNGEPDGIIKESARELLTSKKINKPVPPTQEEELEGYRIYFRNLLAAGITSVGDCWVTPDKIKIYQQLVSEKFPLRFNLYVGVDFLDQVISGNIKKEYSENLRIAGIKLFHGNSLSGKTCWLYEPYDTVNVVSQKKDYFGIAPARSQSELDSLIFKILKAGLQIACHSNGDREIDMVLTAIEQAQKKFYIPDMRHRIEHCSITNPNILNRIKHDSIVPIFHCYINELGGQLKVYGEKRLNMLIPTKTALEMNIPFAFHSDYPISRYESMIRLSSAVNRNTSNGTILGVNQKIGVEDAIRAYTVGGAYTTHEENIKGKLLPGYLADFILVDKDPTAIALTNIETINILMTVVDGKIAYLKSNK